MEVRVRPVHVSEPRHQCGCADIYSASLDCQWVDVTGVPDGDYRVRVTTNPDRTFHELSYENNSAEVGIRIEGDQVYVTDWGQLRTVMNVIIPA